MDLGLKDKVAFITGASRGIGISFYPPIQRSITAHHTTPSAFDPLCAVRSTTFFWILIIKYLRLLRLVTN